ncbi:hypothetical protein [Streptomyces sp. NBC_01022]|uniref:hypothetical protein n=1 Tax=Streptomyces sp. NBC_01022 TaxID=2903723 RepID=UPI002DD8FB7E|nr:hypothetical protein [Streptomyces sp. NBC_01022]WRZ84798.1 hypothetical protein OG316_33340 [Streptomyces sp. NBC_01022]
MSARDELRDCFLSDSRDRFEAAADAFKAEVLREAAAAIGGACPDHANGETCFMDCQCAASRDLRRMADEVATGGTS